MEHNQCEMNFIRDRPPPRSSLRTIHIVVACDVVSFEFYGIVVTIFTMALKTIGGGLGGRPHHFSLGSMIRDNSLSLLVFYTWLGLLAFILLVTVIVYKHRQRMSNFFWEIRTGQWRRGRDRVSQTSGTEEGHTLLAHQRV
ncbi:hypothetical protein CAPTEDRAFT_201878 [Capitella teleta]|uniref:Uncharacterized protein n=1 Tax=Capitella teleta TaxID=283909 RepID=R7VK32_CAPTE|nr:hypothetical protein CAPTEDRAFT_201878 [Capitella teleta]|eukprot:ELU16996.1 hypothetical protein CAPTEDRAFT_201878 [Capitella teleta]